MILEVLMSRPQSQPPKPGSLPAEDRDEARRQAVRHESGAAFERYAESVKRSSQDEIDRSLTHRRWA